MQKTEPDIRPWSESQLKEMAMQHISWEASCLLDSIEEIHTHHDVIELNDYGSNPRGARRPFNHPVSLHDITLHTRVLADFLKCDRSCKNGLHKKNFEARDYIEGWEKVDLLSEDIDFYNGNVVHLGLQRLSSDYDLVELERISNALEVIYALERFIAELSDERRVWFTDLSARLAGGIQTIKDEYAES